MRRGNMRALRSWHFVLCALHCVCLCASARAGDEPPKPTAAAGSQKPDGEQKAPAPTTSPTPPRPSRRAALRAEPDVIRLTLKERPARPLAQSVRIIAEKPCKILATGSTYAGVTVQAETGKAAKAHALAVSFPTDFTGTLAGVLWADIDYGEGRSRVLVPFSISVPGPLKSEPAAVELNTVSRRVEGQIRVRPADAKSAVRWMIADSTNTLIAVVTGRQADGIWPLRVRVAVGSDGSSMHSHIRVRSSLEPEVPLLIPLHVIFAAREEAPPVEPGKAQDDILAAYWARPRIEIPAGQGTPVPGTRKGTVELAIFQDMRSEDGRRALALLSGYLLRQFKGRLRVRVLHFPMDRRCNAELPEETPASDTCMASALLEAARILGGAPTYWALYQKLSARSESLEKLSEDQISEMAAALGLRGEAFLAIARSPQTAQNVAKDIRLGRQAGVKAAPAFFLEGRRVARWSRRAVWQALLGVAARPATTAAQTPAAAPPEQPPPEKPASQPND